METTESKDGPNSELHVHAIVSWTFDENTRFMRVTKTWWNGEMFWISLYIHSYIYIYIVG